jgi:hypothetical protein
MRNESLQPFLHSLTEMIKRTCSFVHNNSKFVSINCEKIKSFITENIDLFANRPTWSECHFNVKEYEDKIDSIIAYTCVLDTLNFCFWPHTQEFEYGDLVNNLNNVLKNNPGFFNSKNLMKLTEPELKEQLYNYQEFPLLDERVKGLNELGFLVESKCEGKFENLVKICDYDILRIIDLIPKEISTFDDKSVYKGKQIYLFKRAQILAADLYSALNELSTPIRLKNVEHLTMFADYRVPQILRELGIFIYSDELAQKIDNFVTICPGSEEEVNV